MPTVAAAGSPERGRRRRRRAGRHRRRRPRAAKIPPPQVVEILQDPEDRASLLDGDAPSFDCASPLLPLPLSASPDLPTFSKGKGRAAVGAPPVAAEPKTTPSSSSSSSLSSSSSSSSSVQRRAGAHVDHGRDQRHQKPQQQHQHQHDQHDQWQVIGERARPAAALPAYDLPMMNLGGRRGSWLAPSATFGHETVAARTAERCYGDSLPRRLGPRRYRRQLPRTRRMASAAQTVR